MKKILALVGGAMLLLVLASIMGVPAALAHAEIESCEPAIDSSIETAPDKLVCTASQGMEADGSTLSVFDAAGAQVDNGDSQVDLNDPDRKLISVSLDTAKMPAGVYTVKWTTISADDGDEASGEFTFTVGPAVEALPTPTGQAETEGETHEEGEADEEGEAQEEGGTHSDDHSLASGTVDGKEVTLQIVAPAKDATLPAGDLVIEAKVEGITLGEGGTHLHFYVDEKLDAMGEGAQTSHTVHLEPGTHDLEVGLATGEHQDSLTAHVHVTVEGTTAPGEPAAQLPSTGTRMNYGAFTLAALGGLVLFALGAFIIARARRS